jgi:hypothetical protein
MWNLHCSARWKAEQVHTGRNQGAMEMKDWRKMLEGIGGYDNEMIGVPSGGVKEMVDDIESLKQQLAEREKQIVMLRDTLEQVTDRMNASDWARVGKALDATKDLSGLVLCDAEPVAKWYGAGWSEISDGEPLYLRKQP